MPFRDSAPVLDDLLLDVVTVIELSDHDREVAENRYRKLKTHLERPSSPLREYLLASTTLIYPQGSMSIGATIVSGTDDDRFDVDALIDMQVPPDWSDDEALDLLEKSLQGFPDVRKIVRCTRAVQLQFAFMHMDVTILDPASEPRPPRIGEIFHSPDTGLSYRVPSNPYGFSTWFRETVVYPEQKFVEEVQKRRREFGINRLQPLSLVEKAEQEKLPPIVPARIDAQQVHALKLLKRFLNLRYERRTLRRPPSIYPTKLAVMCGYEPTGLTAQLQRLATHIKVQMEEAYLEGNGPDERNPRYEEDKLNDRWPATQADRKTLIDDMVFLLNQLEQARDAEIKDILTIFSDLFGERVKERTQESFAKRMDQRSGGRRVHIERGTGAMIPATAVAAPAVARSAIESPQHNFHCEDDREE